MNSNFRYLALLGTLVLWLPFASEAQAIRYELIDGAGGPQGNHTLEGFIEFDLPCGTTCTSMNITDFTFTVLGATNYSYSFQSSEDVVLSPGQGAQLFLTASPQSLIIDYEGNGQLGLGNASTGSPFIRWDHSTISFPSYMSIGPGLTGGWSTSPFFLDPVTIGVVVPEPSTALLMLVVGLVMSHQVRLRYP